MNDITEIDILSPEVETYAEGLFYIAKNADTYPYPSQNSNPRPLEW